MKYIFLKLIFFIAGLQILNLSVDSENISNRNGLILYTQTNVNDLDSVTDMLKAFCSGKIGSLDDLVSNENNPVQNGIENNDFSLFFCGEKIARNLIAVILHSNLSVRTSATISISIHQGYLNISTPPPDRGLLF